MIHAHAFGKYPVRVKNIYDDFGDLWAVCETENGAIEEYLLSDLNFKQRKPTGDLTIEEIKNQTLSKICTVKEDIFTPDQVRKMSKEEIRVNYHKILESMKYWN